MTFDSRERSVHGGEPFEAYRFGWGSNLLLQTGADEPVTLASGIYQPAVISHGPIAHDREQRSGQLEVYVPLEHAVAQLFIDYLPSTPVGLTIYQGHRGEEMDVITYFSGTVLTASFEGAQAVLVCAPLLQKLQRRFPLYAIQYLCPHVLYGPGCGLDKNTHRDTCAVTSVSGHDVVSADFDARADGWFTNGWLELASGERRWIANHVGSTVTLSHPFPAGSIGNGTSVLAYWGCDRTEGTCLAKFDNLANHLGFARVPARNAYHGRIV